jgi:hypothetical protein
MEHGKQILIQKSSKIETSKSKTQSMEINQSNHTDRNSKHNGGRGGTEQAVENNYGTRRKP